MILLASTFTILTIAITWWRPGAGIILAAQAYLLRNFLTNEASQLSEIVADDLLSLLIPIVVFTIIGIKAFKNLKLYQFYYIDVMFLLLGIVLFASGLSSPNVQQGFNITLRYFCFGSSFYFFARLIPLADPKRIKENFHAYLVTTSILAIALGTVAATSLINSAATSRLSIGQANPIPFALLISSGITTNIYWLFNNKKKSLLQTTVIYLSLGFLIFVLTANNTRSMIIALTIVIPFLSLQFMTHKFYTKAIITICTTLLLGSITLYAISYWQPELFNRWIQRLTLINASTIDQGQSIRERFMAANVAIKLFNENPLFGVGTGGFSSYTFLPYPHNLFLEIASEQGMLGLSILGLIIYSIFKTTINMLKIKKLYPLSILFSSLVLLNFIISQFSFTLWQQKNFFLAIGLLVSQLSVAQKKLLSS